MLPRLIRTTIPCTRVLIRLNNNSNMSMPPHHPLLLPPPIKTTLHPPPRPAPRPPPMLALAIICHSKYAMPTPSPPILLCRNILGLLLFLRPLLLERSGHNLFYLVLTPFISTHSRPTYLFILYSLSLMCNWLILICHKYFSNTSFVISILSINHI